MSEYVTLDDIFNFVTASEDFEVKGLGKVKIKPLTREQALSIRGKEMPFSDMEAILCSHAFVQPKLTLDDVRRMQSTLPAGMFEDVTNRIAELSGLNKKVVKDATKSI